MVKLLYDEPERVGRRLTTPRADSSRPPTCTTLDSDARMHWQHRTTYLRVASAHVASSD